MTKCYTETLITYLVKLQNDWTRVSRLPPLQAIAYFEAVARCGTISAAARELTVSASAVSQQIRLLERAMGVSLFSRVKKSLILTEAGEHLFVSASEALALLHGARDQIQRKKERQELVAKVSISFTVSWLMPRLGSFVRAHPDIDLMLHATANRTDFSKENVDFDIRYRSGDWPDLVAEPIIADHFMPVARPDHPVFSAKGDVRQRLADASLIQTVATRVGWQDWLQHNGIEGMKLDHSLRFSAAAFSVQAAEQGLGIALEGTSLLQAPFAAGSLRPVFPELRSIEYPAYWLVCPGHHMHRRPLAAFRGWLQDQTRSHEAEIASYLPAVR